MASKQEVIMSKARKILTTALILALTLTVVCAFSIDPADVAAKKNIRKGTVTLSKTTYTVKYNLFENIVVQKPTVKVKYGKRVLKAFLKIPNVIKPSS